MVWLTVLPVNPGVTLAEAEERDGQSYRELSERQASLLKWNLINSLRQIAMAEWPDLPIPHVNRRLVALTHEHSTDELTDMVDDHRAKLEARQRPARSHTLPNPGAGDPRVSETSAAMTSSFSSGDCELEEDMNLISLLEFYMHPKDYLFTREEVGSSEDEDL